MDIFAEKVGGVNIEDLLLIIPDLANDILVDLSTFFKEKRFHA